jgi:hypothetical protein
MTTRDAYLSALRSLERAEEEVKRHVYFVGGPYRLSSTIAEGQAAERRLAVAQAAFDTARALLESSHA